VSEEKKKEKEIYIYIYIRTKHCTDSALSAVLFRKISSMLILSRLAAIGDMCLCFGEREIRERRGLVCVVGKRGAQRGIHTYLHIPCSDSQSICLIDHPLTLSATAGSYCIDVVCIGGKK
jgi:hypothetical protein